MIKLPNFRRLKQVGLLQIAIVLLVATIVGLSAALFTIKKNEGNRNASLVQEKNELAQMLGDVEKQIEELKNTDQIKRNDDLETEIGNIQKSYNSAVTTYEDLLDFKDKQKDTSDLDTKFAQALASLAKKDYESANKLLAEITSTIATKEQEIAAAFVIPTNVPETAAPPGSGFSKQQVPTAIGNYLVSLVAGNLGSTRIIVDTASASDCANDCPVLSLGDYVARNGAFAGVNGSYFCPASYPTCAGKTNSFDLLVMNKDKTYFNSANNVYSTNPAVIFSPGSMRFVAHASEWGRDTGVDGVISNYPLLVFNKSNMFGGDDDPKKGSKAGRSFVANQGSTGYIGVVHNATVAEAAIVLQTMGMDNAMNLDSGGSTALWSGGYQVGPGRNIPNAVLFVSR